MCHFWGIRFLYSLSELIYLSGTIIICKCPAAGLDPDQMLTSHFVLSGGAICMRCKSGGEERLPTRSSIEWTRDGAFLQSNTGQQQRISDDGSLCILDSLMSDAGNYTCYMFGDPYPHQLSVIG